MEISMREVFVGIPHYPITEYLQLPYSDQVDKKKNFMGSFRGNITVHFPKYLTLGIKYLKPNTNI